jgi:uncharacterized RmlC-like cupin family protein
MRMDSTHKRDHGVRVVRGGDLDPKPGQWPGASLDVAINRAKAGAQKLWAGAGRIDGNAKTGPHHHGELESIIYVLTSRARMRWGDQLEFVAEAGPGDLIYVAPYVPHQEINASSTEQLTFVLVRSDQEPVVVNLDITPAEPPDEVRCIDDMHRTCLPGARSAADERGGDHRPPARAPRPAPISRRPT